MLTLNISQQSAKIEITTVKATADITTTQPKLAMETEAATVEISQPKGELEIDWRPFWGSIGLKDSGDFIRDCAELGKQTALETIGRMSRDGDRLAAIESGEDVAVALAIEASTPPETDVTWAHLELPSIQYTAHKPTFKPSPSRLDMQLIRGTLDLDYQAGRVNIRMVQYPSVKLWVSEGKSIDLHA